MIIVRWNLETTTEAVLNALEFQVEQTVIREVLDPLVLRDRGRLVRPAAHVVQH